ncbi:MAG: hypothetical protein ACE144_19930 [Thermodesulfobacteriota bacterium]
MKKDRSAQIGLYVVAIMFLSMVLFFVFVLLKNQAGDQGRIVKLVLGVVIFLGLFIAVMKGAFKMRGRK